MNNAVDALKSFTTMNGVQFVMTSLVGEKEKLFVGNLDSKMQK